jgi:CDP-diacylglycerol--serine O-phosphatidyltransferase
VPPLPPFKYFIPNALTAMSLLLGLASVVCSSQGDFTLAAWMILWGTLLDKVDGTAARLLGATSAFGVEFDSFADFISFGVAPAALFYYRLTAAGAVPRAVAAACAGLYAVALAVRLARFNIMNAESTIFYGAPGTMIGGCLASGYLTAERHGLGDALLVAAPVVLVVSAFLMVSELRLPKLKMGKNKPLNALIGVCVVAAYVLAPLRMFPEALFAMGTTFMVGGFIAGALMPRDAGSGSAPGAPGLGAA